MPTGRAPRRNARRWGFGELVGAAGLWGGALLAACAPPSDRPTTDLGTTSGTLMLGTIDVPRFGDQRWVDLSAAQQVELAPGAQGGFHVWVRYRTQGITGRVQVLRIADRVPSDGAPSQRVLTTSGFLTIPEGPSWESDVIPSFMCPTPIGVSVLSAPIRLSVRITAADDTSVTLAEKTVTITEQCPPAGDPTRDFCLRICQG